MKIKLLCFLWSLIPISLQAQSLDSLIETGKAFYNRDQLDSAAQNYNGAYQKGDAGIKIRAIGGLISIYIFKSNLAGTDSLIQLGDAIVANNDISVLNLCEYKIKKGEYYRSSSQFQKALKEHQEVIRLSSQLEENKIIQANALYYTALAFESLTIYDSSLIYVDQAYEIYRQELDTNSLKFASIYNVLGICYYRNSRLTEAKTFYFKSKEIAEKQLGRISSDYAIALSNLASISRAEENYQEAIAYTEESLEVFRMLDDQSGVSSAYYSLGVYNYFLGDYGRTKAYMEACISLRKKLYPPNHYSLIGPYEVLGIAFDEMKEYDKTLFYLQKVRPVILESYGEISQPAGFNFENTALSYQNIGKIDSALVYVEKANKILTTVLPPASYGLAANYFNYASILFESGQLQRAESMLTASKKLHEDLGMNTTSEFAKILSLLGLMAAEQNNWIEADKWFLQALNLVRLPQTTLEENLSFQLIPNTLTLLNDYSKYLYRKYKATKAPEVLESFEQYSNIYLSLSERFRKQFNDPYNKSIIAKDNAEVYNRNLGVYNELYRTTGQQQYLKSAFRFSEYGRATFLRDLQDAKIASYAGVPDSILEKENQLKQKLANLNQSLLEAPESDEIRESIFEVKEELDLFIENTANNYPSYYNLKFNTNIPSLEAIQGQLEEEESLVEFMQDDTAYYALLCTQQSSTLFYLGNRKNINEQILIWQAQITSRDTAVLETGKFLNKHLWAPFEDQLQGRKITIIPCGQLFYLNFEALPTLEETGTYLIHNYTINYALSLSIQFSKAPPRKGKGVLAIAPGFDDQMKKNYQNSLDSFDLIDEAYLRTVRQPWTIKLLKRLKNKSAYQTFIGPKASESNVKTALKNKSVLYFGTHAIMNASDPLRSKLVLAKEQGAQQEDGYLNVYEIYGIPLQAELAVLNACESGLGELQEGEGMISLAYSLHYAGCEQTIMSLWKIDEKVNTQITQAFLDYLEAGQTTSEALRQAKIDFLAEANPQLKHAFYWGGMVMMGKDGQVAIISASPNLKFGLIIFGILSVLLVIYFSNNFKKNIKDSTNKSV